MDKEHTAIERIKLASEMSLRHYGKPLVCTYSGGKDSEVVLELFKRSGIPYEVHNSHTTADAPPDSTTYKRGTPKAGESRSKMRNPDADIQGKTHNHVETDTS